MIYNKAGCDFGRSWDSQDTTIMLPVDSAPQRIANIGYPPRRASAG